MKKRVEKEAGFIKKIITNHDNGKFVIHTLPDPSTIFEKLDHPCIINNLREDGGSELRDREDYQLYTIVSCSLLPASQYPIEQRIFRDKLMCTYLFIGIDLEKTQIKQFCLGDARSEYGYKNKHGRPTYKARFYCDEIQSLPPATRFNQIIKYNDLTAYQQTQPRGDEESLFGVEPPIFIRPYNELLLKINSESMLCLGAIAEDVSKNPVILLGLILLQLKLRTHLGITYPIILYNNTLQDIMIDFIDSAPIIMHTNSIHAVDNKLALIQMLNSFPEGVPINELDHIFMMDELLSEEEKNRCFDNGKQNYTLQRFFTALDYPLDQNNHPIVKSNEELYYEDYRQRQDFLNNTQYGLTLLSKLPSFTEEDGVIGIHKINNKHADPEDQYLEINQDALKKFILKSFFQLDNNEQLSTEQETIYFHYIKAYNLQFRLEYYEKLLLDPHATVNFSKLKEDLEWGVTLQELLTSENISTPGFVS